MKKKTKKRREKNEKIDQLILLVTDLQSADIRNYRYFGFGISQNRYRNRKY
jgi:hypothetical protein